MLDLRTIDPATVPASPELDALIAEQWMRWNKATPKDSCWYWTDTAGKRLHSHLWSPSTNPAHAGEARRKAEYSQVIHHNDRTHVQVDSHFVTVYLTETNGDKGKAEALATCRAIVAVLKAAKAVGGGT